ncbi:hypothetical protein POTOM_060272 [Populus tomentosa]|uniref:Uncharacterized protein n=1 Tax=Populus tomentosa TaxID=118781 RepID=A0A8X7XU45_POPTO|nr:hypothetical protein POTOM_060272 [Populus tomentosa]
MTVFSLVLLTYFMVVSGIVYDVIVEPPGIGSTQDPYTGSVKPVVFLPGRVNGPDIIEGLSSGFMFVVGGVGIILMDLALEKNRAKSVKVSYATAGISSVVIAYVMIRNHNVGLSNGVIVDFCDLGLLSFDLVVLVGYGNY